MTADGAALISGWWLHLEQSQTWLLLGSPLALLLRRSWDEHPLYRKNGHGPTGKIRNNYSEAIFRGLKRIDQVALPHFPRNTSVSHTQHTGEPAHNPFFRSHLHQRCRPRSPRSPTSKFHCKDLLFVGGASTEDCRAVNARRLKNLR